MKISVLKDQFDPIAEGRRTAFRFSEHQVQVDVGDRIQFVEAMESSDPTGRAVSVVVTDVFRSADAPIALLSIRRLQDQMLISTPEGPLTVVADDSNIEDYPGFSVLVGETLAAVVEWHSEKHTIVLRTYNDHEDEPQHYHSWNGTPLEP